MDKEAIRACLERYRQGAATMEESVEAISRMPYENMGFAQLDYHREMRQGFPEVIFAEGKTNEQTRRIFSRLLAESKKSVMATRVSEDMAAFVREAVPEAVYDEAARILYVRRNVEAADESRRVLVLTAGTSDIPVAREAALTAELLGNAVDTCFDVGVAGIHRLFAHEEEIMRANVIIVVAGMEGALASVVGGMTARPVIAVPTSVGYGASFHGLSALLAMLNSCAAGVAVMNIDNGYGAGVLASKINKERGVT